MKIGVLAYDATHWKTQNGLINLLMSGHRPDVVMAAPLRDLKFYRSSVRITPKDLFLWHPAEICARLGIDYHRVEHNSAQCQDIVSEAGLDVGIILGARILKQSTIDAFRVGIINVHPGILPENRGLDNIKWAVLNDRDQGATAHLIDREIDRGRMICQDRIRVYGDDSLMDLKIRLQHLEQRLMVEALEKVMEAPSAESFPLLEEGEYHKPISAEMEETLDERLREYVSSRGV